MWWSCLRVLLFQTAKNRLHFAVWASICGTALGVAALLVVTTVASGFIERLNFFLSHLNPQVLVLEPQGWTHPQALVAAIQKKSPDWTVSSFIYQEGFLTHITPDNSQTQGIYLRACDWENSPIRQTLSVQPAQAWHSLSMQSKETHLIPVILGQTLSQNLHAKLGDIVSLSVFLPAISVTSQAGLRQVDVLIVGIANVGLEQYDATMVLADRHLWQQALVVQQWANGLEVFLPHADGAIQAAQKLEHDWNVWAIPWQTLEQGLLNHVKRDGIMVSIVVAVISLVACSNVVVTLILLFLDKQKSFTTLRVLGIPSLHLGFVLLTTGIGLSLSGALFGALIAMGILELLSGFALQDFSQFYYLKTIPVSLSPLIIMGVLCGTIVVATLGSLYPAWRMVRLHSSFSRLIKPGSTNR